MKQPTNTSKIIHLAAGLVMLGSFFLPWVNWKGAPISGYYLPAGKFFDIAGSQFGLSNPYPQFDFSFYAFWLIPALTIIALLLNLAKKKANWPTLIAGALNLSLVTIFCLFTQTLGDLGVRNSIATNLWIAAMAALVFIASSFPPYNWLKKIGWIIIGPLFAYTGFMIIQKTVWNQTFEETNDLKPDFTVSARTLLNEFASNDSLANNKYREKILEVSGTASTVEQLKDSTVNIRFEDSTGSYIIFPFEKKYYVQAKNLKAGDAVTAKGSCSGSIHSEILGTTSISFKRSTLIKK
jgi:hypothetical protein